MGNGTPARRNHLGFHLAAVWKPAGLFLGCHPVCLDGPRGFRFHERVEPGQRR